MNDSATEDQNTGLVPAGRPHRVVEMKLSLEWCLGILGAGFFIAATLWFNVQQLTKNVEALTIAVNSGNTAYNVLSGKLSLLEYRMGIYEHDLKTSKEKGGRP